MAGQTKSIRTYSELLQLGSYEERVNYLRLDGKVGFDTFGFDRYLNQMLYSSNEWKKIVRPRIVLRDGACDLGLSGMEIQGKIIVHHMNPLTVADIENSTDFLFNDEYLICVSPVTHNLIHFGGEALSRPSLTERRPNDTCPWKIG